MMLIRGGTVFIIEGGIMGYLVLADWPGLVLALARTSAVLLVLVLLVLVLLVLVLLVLLVLKVVIFLIFSGICDNI